MVENVMNHFLNLSKYSNLIFDIYHTPEFVNKDIQFGNI